MTILVGAAGGSPYPFPTMPLPLKDEGLISTVGNIIPHKGILIDNVKIPTAFTTGATGQYDGRLGTTVVWSVGPTDINASADGFLATISSWYDSVNDRYYVFAIDQATTPDTFYTAYITLETGTVTNVGNAQLTTDPTGANTINKCAVSRTSIDSGNFTLTFDDRIIVINESTGAEVSNVASTNTTDSNNIGAYSTLDGLIFVETFGFNTTGIDFLLLTRGGNSVRIPLPTPLLSSGVPVTPITWGDKVKIYRNSTITTERVLRTFLRADFDAWLTKLADFGGLA